MGALQYLYGTDAKSDRSLASCVLELVLWLVSARTVKPYTPSKVAVPCTARPNATNPRSRRAKSEASNFSVGKVYKAREYYAFEKTFSHADLVYQIRIWYAPTAVRCAVAPPRPPGTDIIIKQVLAPLPCTEYLRVTEKCDTEQLVAEVRVIHTRRPTHHENFRRQG
jgi:hypothetical protein